MTVPEISAADAAARRGHPGVVFLDVREPDEHAAARIEGAAFVPMREVPARLAELDSGSEIIVFCHLGTRSAMVVDWLRRNGFPSAVNLAGGIDAWSLEVDPEVPRYR
ncbi:MAG TPA: rhodanese-like domain-containing protein [Thermoanaerobaculia bacterium]|nr:rhodanese-like domain-containing protein [Thermoanaerobaculia bacterium]